MPKYLIDLWLDGYDSEEEMEEACLVFIEESLNISSSSLTIEKVMELKDERATK